MTNQEAVELLDNLIGMVEDNQHNDYDEAFKMGIKALENQKTGHWIEMNINPDGTHNIYCSNCNRYQKFKGHANSYNAKTKLKYCPNCGAKMEGE